MIKNIRQKINYNSLNARQKETYNYQKISSLLADYWFTTIKLSDDWLGADFIAMPFSWKDFLRIQLKGRMTFSEKYKWKDLYICFEDKTTWNRYIYDHDEVLSKFIDKIRNSISWKKEWGYSYSVLSKEHKEILKPYILT